MRQIFIVGVLLALAGGAAFFPGPAFAASLDQLCAGGGEVMPGVGIGSVKIGASFVDTVARLGTPASMGVNSNHEASLDDTAGWHPITHSEQGTHGFAWAVFGSNVYGIRVIGRENVVEAIEIERVTGCQDPHGITMNTPGATIINTYGQPDGMHATRTGTPTVNLAYNSTGVAFKLKLSGTGLGTVLDIMVFTPGRFCRIIGRTTCSKYTPPLT